MSAILQVAYGDRLLRRRNISGAQQSKDVQVVVATMFSESRPPILVIAFKFPPFPRVGGFRWRMLTKHLARLGHPVHVITVRWPESTAGRALLERDLADPRIRIYRTRSGAPHRLVYMPPRGRLAATATGLLLPIARSALWWDDEAQRWGRYVLPRARELLDSEPISTVIATGHPFQANRWAAHLRAERPNIRLIQDFRDPWLNPHRSWSPRRTRRIEAWQREALAAADVVVSVTPSFLDGYLSAAPRGSRGVVIPNGFDPDRRDEIVRTGRPDSPVDPPVLTYAGNAFVGRQEPLDRLLSTVRSLPRGTVRVRLIGLFPRELIAQYTDLVSDGRLEIREPVSHQDALAAIAESTAALHLNARDWPGAVSSKIYEHAMLRVPTIALAYGGETDALIAERDLGTAIHADDPELPKRLVAALDAAVAHSYRFAIEDCSYDRLAERYSRLIVGGRDV